MLLKNLLITTLITFMATSLSYALQISDSEISDLEHTTGTLAIQENDFACFQNLECLKRNNPLNSSNLDKIVFNPDRFSQYIVEGSSRDEYVYAVYNEKGDLIRGTVVQRNIVLPNSIYKVLANDGYSSWKMIGNERVVQNFDSNSMTYKVILNRGDEVRVEYFDSKGNRKVPMS